MEFCGKWIRGDPIRTVIAAYQNTCPVGNRAEFPDNDLPCVARVFDDMRGAIRVRAHGQGAIGQVVSL